MVFFGVPLSRIFKIFKKEYPNLYQLPITIQTSIVNPGSDKKLEKVVTLVPTRAERHLLSPVCAAPSVPRAGAHARGAAYSGAHPRGGTFLCPRERGGTCWRTCGHPPRGAAYSVARLGAHPRHTSTFSPPGRHPPA